jgi:hypothetical protein
MQIRLQIPRRAAQYILIILRSSGGCFKIIRRTDKCELHEFTDYDFPVSDSVILVTD